MIKIIIVDDSAFLRRILREHLSRKRSSGILADGCSLFEAGTKDEALKLFKNEQPDLVFLDIVMDQSDHDGIDVLIEFMRCDKKPRIIMMSAIGQERIIDECMSRGAVGYILKPFEEEQVMTSLEHAMASDSAGQMQGLSSYPQ